MSKKFDEMYAQIATTIEFNPKWANGTGYFDNAVDGEEAPVLEVGQVVKTVTPMPNNRRIIIIGTPIGNIVLFDRFTGNEHGVIVQNVPMHIEKLFGLTGEMKEDMIQHFLGYPYEGSSCDNIGHRLAGWSYTRPSRKKAVAA